MSQARDFADSFSAVSTGRRNMIINGAMQVAQRGTSFTGAANNTYPVDRFRVYRNGMDNLVYDLSQSSTAPEGFANSLKLDVTTAETASADSENLKIATRIEAQNIQHLLYNTSNAKSITLSFWVRSSTTGTYVIEIYTQDPNRQITNTYTVNATDTWEHKTVTFVGDTSGAINDDNGIGLDISWYLSVPSNYKTGDSTSWRTFNSDGRGYGQTADVAATTGDFYITGVQLELGNSASPFEHRSYGEEVALCQRYYNRYTTTGTEGGIMNFSIWSSVNKYGGFTFTTEMRANPTLAISDLSDLNFYSAANTGVPTNLVRVDGDTKYAEIRVSHSNFGVSGESGWLRIIDGTNGWLAFDAEL